MKSTERKFEFLTREDPDTGARVTRLTPPDVTCHRNYFYQKCFTNDGRKLVFGGEFGPHPSPNWNYHLLDLDTQRCIQLTDGAGENSFGGFLSPDDKYLFFVRATRQFIRLDLATLKEDVLYVVPDGWVGYGTWVSNSACTKIVGIEIAADDWFPLTTWQKFNEMFHKRPLCRLFSVDLATGQRTVILEQRGWLGHPQYRPFDDNTVAYCHEGPHDLIDARMWFIDEDGTNRRCGKEHLDGESCTHEFWVPDGSAMIYVSYNHSSPERWICSLDPVTLENKVLTAMPQCSHLMSNHDGTLIVGDGVGKVSLDNTASNEMLVGDPYLHLFDLKAGTTRKIARHDSGWGVYKDDRQVTHPHPSFTPDNKQVLFSCDKESASGIEPALYLVDLVKVTALALAGLVAAAHAQRPQLTPEQAALHTTAAYLGDWQPAPLADLSAATPDFVVKAGESVQAAIDKVPAEGTKRWVIQIQPGTYRGPLCIKDKAPLALIGATLDAAAVVLVDNRFSGKPKAENEPAHPCWPELGKTTIGTSGSTSVLVQSNDVQLISLTVANDAMDGVRRGEAYPPGVGESGGAQAVALTLTGDRIQLENVRLLGHQDTLYVKRRTPDAPARQLVRHSLIAGDVDFIFGNATLVIAHSTVLTRANRRTPGHGGIIFAPSTAPNLNQGFLVTHSRLVGEPGIAPGATALGRAWDAGVKAGTWLAGTSPNGMAVVRDSEIGAHVGPWNASTSRRPFDATSNRLFEFNNR